MRDARCARQGSTRCTAIDGVTHDDIDERRARIVGSVGVGLAQRDVVAVAVGRVATHRPHFEREIARAADDKRFAVARHARTDDRADALGMSDERGNAARCDAAR